MERMDSGWWKYLLFSLIALGIQTSCNIIFIFSISHGIKNVTWNWIDGYHDLSSKFYAKFYLIVCNKAIIFRRERLP